MTTTASTTTNIVKSLKCASAYYDCVIPACIDLRFSNFENYYGHKADDPDGKGAMHGKVEDFFYLPVNRNFYIDDAVMPSLHNVNAASAFGKPIGYDSGRDESNVYYTSVVQNFTDNTSTYMDVLTHYPAGVSYDLYVLRMLQVNGVDANHRDWVEDNLRVWKMRKVCSTKVIESQLPGFTYRNSVKAALYLINRNNKLCSNYVRYRDEVWRCLREEDWSGWRDNMIQVFCNYQHKSDDDDDDEDDKAKTELPNLPSGRAPMPKSPPIPPSPPSSSDDKNREASKVNIKSYPIKVVHVDSPTTPHMPLVTNGNETVYGIIKKYESECSVIVVNGVIVSEDVSIAEIWDLGKYADLWCWICFY